MQDIPAITMPALLEIYLVPVELADPTSIPIRDEESRILLDESGLPICEG